MFWSAFCVTNTALTCVLWLQSMHPVGWKPQHMTEQDAEEAAAESPVMPTFRVSVLCHAVLCCVVLCCAMLGDTGWAETEMLSAEM